MAISDLFPEVLQNDGINIVSIDDSLKGTDCNDLNAIQTVNAQSQRGKTVSEASSQETIRKKIVMRADERPGNGITQNSDKVTQTVNDQSQEGKKVSEASNQEAIRKRIVVGADERPGNGITQNPDLMAELMTGEDLILSDLIKAGYSEIEAMEAMTKDRTGNLRNQNKVMNVDAREVVTTGNGCQMKTPSFSDVLKRRDPKIDVPPPTIMGGNILIYIDPLEHQKRVEANKFSLLGRLFMPNDASSTTTHSLKKRMAMVLGFESFKVMLMGRGYYHIYPDSMEIRNMLLSKGVVNLNPGTIRLSQWVPNFSSHKQKNSTTTQVWVQIHELPIEYWGENLFNIARGLGVLLRVDESQNHELFARMLVEIDLLKPLPKQLLIKDSEKDFYAKVVYEQVPEFCEECKIIGHSRMNCRKFAKVANKINTHHVTIEKKELEVARNRIEVGAERYMEKEKVKDLGKHNDIVERSDELKVDKEYGNSEGREREAVLVQTCKTNEMAVMGGKGAVTNAKTSKSSQVVGKDTPVDTVDGKVGTNNSALLVDATLYSKQSSPLPKVAVVPISKVWENLKVASSSVENKKRVSNGSEVGMQMGASLEPDMGKYVKSLECDNDEKDMETEYLGDGNKNYCLDFLNINKYAKLVDTTKESTTPPSTSENTGGSSKHRHRKGRKLGYGMSYGSTCGRSNQRWGDVSSEEESEEEEKSISESKKQNKKTKPKLKVEGGRKEPPLTSNRQKN